MKKIYLSILTIALAGTTVAQVNQTERGRTPSPQLAKQKPTHSVGNQLKVTLWSSDFTNAGDWTIGNSAGNTADWTISNAPSFWWSGNATLASTSGGNMASFNSDSYATAANTIANNAYVQTANAIDCSGQPAIAVSFEQYFNKWTGRTIVEVSNDGGTTWVDYELNASMGNNDETTNPAVATVDISATAGNEPAVLVRILYLSNAISDGGTDNSAGEGWDYGWIVDDFAIGTLPDNDLALTKGWHHDIVNAYEYSMLPLSQAREMVPGVIVQNQGALQQTTDVTCTITDGGGSTVSTTTQSVTVPNGTEDTVFFNTAFTPSALDDYTVTFTIPADMDPTDDSFTASVLTINQDLMAHDYGATSSFGWNPASTNQGTVDNAHSSHSWGNIYVPTVDQDIYGVDINFASGTTAGMYFLVRVQQVPNGGSIQDPLTWVNEVDFTVQASDIGTGITTVVFPSPATLTAGEAYIIDVLKVDGTSGTEAFYIGGSDVTSEDEDFSTVCFGPYGQASAVNYFVNWGFAPYVRANFNMSLGIDENASLEGVTVYPNPSEGIVNISNDNSIEHTIEVRNLAGQLISMETTSIATKVDLTNEAAGVYVVKVSNENGVMAQKVTIK